MIHNYHFNMKHTSYFTFILISPSSCFILYLYYYFFYEYMIRIQDCIFRWLLQPLLLPRLVKQQSTITSLFRVSVCIVQCVQLECLLRSWILRQYKYGNQACFGNRVNHFLNKISINFRYDEMFSTMSY